jgi:ferredoxin--NADP+ reductase
VIGTNKKDALDTVTAMLEDVAEGRIYEPPGEATAEAAAEMVAERVDDAVSFGGWQAIDEAEVGRGEPHGRPRIKFVSVEEMLDAATTTSEA